jgi:hypothetical protein
MEVKTCEKGVWMRWEGLMQGGEERDGVVLMQMGRERRRNEERGVER